MKTPVARSRNQQWTEAEDERLRAFVAQGASVIRVSAALKRKVISVRQRARKIPVPESVAAAASNRKSLKRNRRRRRRNHNSIYRRAKFFGTHAPRDKENQPEMPE